MSNSCDLMNCSLPGSSVHGLSQARMLEWVGISFSRGSLPPRDWTWVSSITGRVFMDWTTREAWEVRSQSLRTKATEKWERKFHKKVSHKWRYPKLEYWLPLDPGLLLELSTVVVQSLSRVWLLVTPWTVACQASLLFIISQSLLRFMSIESVILSNHLILCHSLLLLTSVFHSIRIFSNEWALCIS